MDKCKYNPINLLRRSWSGLKIVFLLSGVIHQEKSAIILKDQFALIQRNGATAKQKAPGKLDMGQFAPRLPPGIQWIVRNAGTRILGNHSFYVFFYFINNALDVHKPAIKSRQDHIVVILISR